MINKIEAQIIEKFGILVSHDNCAALFGRTPDGFRVTLTGDNELSRALKPARIKLGRRVMYRACDLARVISESGGNHA